MQQVVEVLLKTDSEGNEHDSQRLMSKSNTPPVRADKLSHFFDSMHIPEDAFMLSHN